MGNCADVIMPNKYEVKTEENNYKNINSNITEAIKLTRTLQENSEKKEARPSQNIKLVNASSSALGKSQIIHVSKIQNLVRGHLYRKKISYKSGGLEEAVQETRTFRSGDGLIERNNSESNLELSSGKNRMSKLSDCEFLKRECPTKDSTPESMQENVPQGSVQNNELETSQIYKGSRKHGKKHGFGIFRLKDSAVYRGSFENDKALGFGVLTHSNGDIYSGQWVSNRSNGLGRYTNPHGSYYEGNWVSDKRHGFGIEKLLTGNLYYGEYSDGCKKGIGILNLLDTTNYEGEFANNDINGIGTYSFKDNRKYEGEWVDNKMHGYGILTWTDGKYFEGSFVNDKKEGFGVYFAHSKIYVGIWNNSKLNGDIIIVDKGVIKKYRWADGKKVKILSSKYPIAFENIVSQILDDTTN